MQRILDLIEATLDAEITPRELADRSGYSLWHFLHLFQQEVGMPLCRYRTRRRIAHAIWHISRGMSITDAALRWGFETHSGFYRAFAREYGESPTAFLRTHRVQQPSVPVIKEEVFRMLTREKFREALSHWEIDVPLTPVTYPSGHMSETAVYAGEDLLLKAYRDEPSCRLAIALADALCREGIPASRAIPLPDGSDMLPVADGMWMTLCRRIPGKPMRADEVIRDPERSGLRIGEALARLHKAAASLDDALCPDDEPYAEHLLSWAYPTAKDSLPDNFPADFPARAEALRMLPTAIIHRDPNPANLIDAGTDVGFTDFDLSRRSLRIFDPCYFMTAVLSETFGRDDLPWQTNWPILCASVLSGYERVTPLTPSERAAIPTMIIGNELLCLAAFAGSSKYRDVFDVNRRMLAWIPEALPEAPPLDSARDAVPGPCSGAIRP